MLTCDMRRAFTIFSTVQYRAVLVWNPVQHHRSLVSSLLLQLALRPDYSFSLALHMLSMDTRRDIFWFPGLFFEILPKTHIRASQKNPSSKIFAYFKYVKFSLIHAYHHHSSPSPKQTTQTAQRLLDPPTVTVILTKGCNVVNIIYILYLFILFQPSIHPSIHPSIMKQFS
jgi:hypothetical protein